MCKVAAGERKAIRDREGGELPTIAKALALSYDAFEKLIAALPFRKR